MVQSVADDLALLSLAPVRAMLDEVASSVRVSATAGWRW
jgi:hypothetical protein